MPFWRFQSASKPGSDAKLVGFIAWPHYAPTNRVGNRSGMAGAALLQSSHRRTEKGPAAMPRRCDFYGRQRNWTVKRCVIFLFGVIATALLVGCAMSPQSLGITGPGDQQNSPGVRHGIKSQHNVPYS
jgi:hypothetical protein